MESLSRKNIEWTTYGTLSKKAYLKRLSSSRNESLLQKQVQQGLEKACSRMDSEQDFRKSFTDRFHCRLEIHLQKKGSQEGSRGGIEKICSYLFEATTMTGFTEGVHASVALRVSQKEPW